MDLPPIIIDEELPATATRQPEGLFGLNIPQAQKYIACVIDAHELIRRFGEAKAKKGILPFLPYAAAASYLFGAERAGRIVAVAVGGPTDRPLGLYNFHRDGKKIYVAYALTHPDYRDQGCTLADEIAYRMILSFPRADTFCFWRNKKGRGPLFYSHSCERKMRQLEKHRWISSDHPQDRGNLDVLETQRSGSSNGSTKAP